MKILGHIGTSKENPKSTEAQRKAPIKTHVITAISGMKSKLLEPLREDIFTPKIMTLDMPGRWGEEGVQGKVIKKISLQKRSGGKAPGYILQSTKNNYTYYACTEDEALCRMRLYLDRNNQMYVDSLYGQAGHGKYKGAGTELLKFAVQKSKKEGDKGRLWLTVGGSPKFYYKSNFRISPKIKDHVRKNAVYDLATRQNLYMDDIWDKYWDVPNLTLEIKEAGALLSGERLCDKTHSEYMGDKEIEYQTKKGEKRKMTIGLDFSDLSNCTNTENVFVAQAYRKDGERMKPCSNIEMRLLKDENSDKYLNIDTFNVDYIAKEEVMEALMEVVEAKSKELGAKYIKKDEAVWEEF